MTIIELIDAHEILEPVESVHLNTTLRRIGEERPQAGGEVLGRAVVLQQFRDDRFARQHVG